MSPTRIGKARVQRQHLGSTKHRESPERQAKVTRPVDVEDIELPLAQGAVEIVRCPWADRGLGEGPPATKGARAPDTNHVTLGVLGSGHVRIGGAPGQNRDLHALTAQEVAQMAHVLLNTSKVGEVALGYDADAERTHDAFRCSLS